MLAQNQNAANARLLKQSILEAFERISEILFGLIIVLTFTCSLGFQRVERHAVRALLIDAVGCSVAWGIIDVVFFLPGRLSEQGHSLLLLHRVRKTAIALGGRQRGATDRPSDFDHPCDGLGGISMHLHGDCGRTNRNRNEDTGQQQSQSGNQ